jgi:hypothetical protein
VIIFAGENRRDYGATVRLLSYAQAPSVFSWIPIVNIFTGLYQLYLEVVGVMKVHRTSAIRATLSVLGVLLVIGGLIVGAVVIFAIYSQMTQSTAQELQHSTDQAAQDMEERVRREVEGMSGEVYGSSPPTGTYFVRKMSGGYGELIIKNGRDLDAVAVLTSSWNPKTPLMAVYIQAGDTYTIDGIEDGTYELFFTLGEDWDSDQEKFTRNTAYSRFEDPFEFRTTSTTYTAYEVTLYAVVGGTADTDPVSESDFPGLS